ncbi:MAG: hypothetical protein JWP97_4586 [Labilithrix sp.]|nr:hypothetical protein [Labilithrix sp.]
MRLRSSLVELLLVGGGTLVLLPIGWLLRHVVGLDDAELTFGFLTFYAAYVINDPHFAVTYLLFYKDLRARVLGPATPRPQRLRYVLAGLVTPVVLVGWAGTSLLRHDAESIGAMVQLMFLLVGWHYTKQGFGVLTVLASRRGVNPSPRERRAVSFHCYAGWAFAWSNPATPAGAFEEKGVVYHALAHPRWLELLTGTVLAVSTLVLVYALVSEGRRLGRWLPVAPLAGLLVTIWSWTIFSSVDPLLRYAIPALHSIQYLYFVWLMRRNHARSFEGPPTFGRPAAVQVGFLAAGALALGWLLLRGAPTFLDGLFAPRTPPGGIPDAFGETPYFAAFYVVVNVHHYVMDSAIWRRDNPDTRFLREPA